MMTVMAVMIYGGGFGFTWERRGFFRALVWPVALGIVLAQVTETQMIADKPSEVKR